MATIRFTYEGKCTGDHLYIAVNLNGTKRRTLITTGYQIKTARLTADDADDVAEMMLKAFCRGWYAANPAGTLAQLRTALEAQSWTI